MSLLLFILEYVVMRTKTATYNYVAASYITLNNILI